MNSKAVLGGAEMYLGTVWYGVLVIKDLDVTMATQSGQDSIGLMWILS